MFREQIVNALFEIMYAVWEQNKSPQRDFA